ncbi:hypothetical protein ACFPYJ_01280 [Paenibacillus solisilvae]|uniref:DUF2207 domain-containing protein n=1 Tax=Paenibacillus solisilvae TaxID=2486751 RepID=A0ABW0VPR8_9BACL
MNAIFGFILAIAVIGIVLLLTTLSNRSKSHYIPQSGGGRRSGFPARKPPLFLGVPEKHPARSVAVRLETVLTADFEERVKDRVLKVTPRMREGEWQWLWFELKRYFLMCAILRGVPMYGSRVDDVWHEMLMFTREYEQFCQELCGRLIHHAPHTSDARPEPGERAWFDWIYGELFEAAPASGQLWGSFYKVPLSPDRIRELEGLDADALKHKFFNKAAADLFPDINNTVLYLIERGKALASRARRGERRPASKDKYNQSQWDDPVMMTGLLSGALFFSSLHDEGDFNRHMDNAQTKEQREQYSGGGSTYVCSGESGGHHGHDHGHGHGHHGGGSSCSSGSGDGGGGSSCGGSSCGGGGS